MTRWFGFLLMLGAILGAEYLAIGYAVEFFTGPSIALVGINR